MAVKKNCYSCAHYSIGVESWELSHITWPECDKDGPKSDQKTYNMQEPGYMKRYKRCWEARAQARVAHSPKDET